MTSNLSHLKRLIFTAVMSGFIFTLYSCKPDGYINKVKHDGEKYTNTCDSFKEDIDKLVAKNSDPLTLKVSQYDNSDARYFLLEQGQFEQVGDTLIFRLEKDLNYNTYLAKRVAIHVNASVKAGPNMEKFDGSEVEDLGKLVINEEYLAKNNKPYFAYKFPLNGKSIAGKQIQLSFAIAKYNKDGTIKNYYCETDANPIGIAQPSCCTAKRWENSQLQTVAELPKIEAKEENFKYESFTGTLDVQFEEASSELSDDSTFDASLIQYYVEKYDGLDFQLQRVDLTGYASPGGKESFNQKLSDKRAGSLKTGLQLLNEKMESLEVTAVGKGEDWERVKLLTEISSLTEEQQKEVLDICNDETLTNDQKEALLRKVKFWDTLVEEVLIKARHTFAIMDFNYDGSVPTLKRYVDRHPVASMKTEEVAKKVFNLQPENAANDKSAEKAELEEVLRETASPNLYAIRATYHVAAKDYKSAVEDLEKASRFRGVAAEMFQPTIAGYKVLLADDMALNDQVDLYDKLKLMVSNNPSNASLNTNLAIMMDKIGYLGGALDAYGKMNREGESTDLLVNRGVTKAKANMITSAMNDFEEVLKVDPNNGAALFNMAAMHAYKGNTFKTIDFLDKAIAVNPDYKKMIFNNPVFSVLSEDPRFEKYRD
ncbi:MAG: hypothetical protein MRZ79_08915 [Bacteroidia bacterium]|nr:hypothetical protein [Bacteroidia bacterium]